MVNKFSREMSNFFKRNLNNLTFFGGKALFNKLWPLLYKKAKLDLRLTKSVVIQFMTQIHDPNTRLASYFWALIQFSKIFKLAAFEETT